MKKSEEIIVSDKDIQQIEKLVVVVNKTIEALKSQDKTLQQISKTFEKVGNSATKFADAAKSIGDAGKSIGTFVTQLANAETKLSTMVVKLTAALDKMAQGKNAMVQAQYGEAVTTQKARSSGTPKKQTETGERASDIQALLSIRAEYNNALRTQIELMQEIRDMYEASPDKSPELASFSASEITGIQAKIDAIKELISLTDIEIQKLQMMNLAAQDSMSLNMNTAKVQNAQENPDWKAAKDMEAEYQRIVAVNAQLYGILQQIVVLKEKIGLSTTEEAEDLSILVAQYKQITAESKAIADNKVFDKGIQTSTATNKQEIKLQQKDVALEVGSTQTAAEIAAVNIALKEQAAAHNEVAQAEAARARLAEGRTAYLTEEQQANRMAIEEDKQRTQQIDREIELTIKLKLVKENEKNTQEAILAVKEKLKRLQKENGSKQEIKDAKDHEKALKGEAQGLKTVKEQLEKNVKANKSFMESNTAAYYTTEQFMQVVRELPNFAISARTGIMSLSNNLPQMISGFYKAYQGGLGFSGILKNLISPMSLVNIAATGLMILFMQWDNIMDFFNDKIVDVGKAMRDMSKEIADGSSEITKTLKSFEDLRYELNRFPEHTENLAKYNEEFGATYGIAKDTAEAYVLMGKNADDYYGRVIRHEIANKVRLMAFEKLQEKLSEQFKKGIFGVGWEEKVGGAIEGVTNNFQALQDAVNNKEVAYELSGSGFQIGAKDMLDAIEKAGLENAVKLTTSFGIAQKYEREALNKMIKSGNILKLDLAALDEKQRKNLLNALQEKGLKDIDEANKKFAMSQKLMVEISNTIAGMIDVEVPEDKGDKGNSKYKSKQAAKLKIAVRHFKEMFTKEEQYNKDRAKLELENELLQMSITANAYNTEANSLKKRLDAYQRFYQNKQKIADIDRTSEMRKISQDAEAQAFAAKQRITTAKQQLADDQKRLAEYRVQVSEYTQEDKEKAQKAQKAQIKTLENEAERLYKEMIRLRDGGKTSSDVIDALATQYSSKVDEAKALASAGDDFLIGSARYAAVAAENIAQSEKNLIKMIESIEGVGGNLEIIESNATLKMLAAIDKFALTIIKAKREEYQSYSDLYKDQLADELTAYKVFYDDQIRIFDAYIDKRKRVSGGMGIESGYKKDKKLKNEEYTGENVQETIDVGWKFAEIIGSLSDSYQRPKFIDDYNQLAISIDEVWQKSRFQLEMNKKIQDSYQSLIEKVEDYAKTNKITSEQIGVWATEASDVAIEAAKARGLSDLEASKEGGKAYERTSELLKKSVTKGILDSTELNKALKDAKAEEIQINKDTNATIMQLQEKQKEAMIAEIIEMSVSMIGELMKLGDALMAKAIEEDRRALDQWKTTQSQLLEDSIASQVLTQKEGDAQKKALEEEERKRKYEINMREFKQKQSMAYADIAISSAVAIAMAWATSAGNPILAGIITGLIGASAIISAATVAQQLPPAYARGTGFHKGGLAVVGDGGRSEAVITPSGNIYKTPSTDTLVNLERGSKVMPDFDAFMFKQLAVSNGDINVKVDNKRMLELQSQTNRSLARIAANTRKTRVNNNRLWIN